MPIAADPWDQQSEPRCERGHGEEAITCAVRCGACGARCCEHTAPAGQLRLPGLPGCAGWEEPAGDGLAQFGQLLSFPADVCNEGHR